MIEPIVIRFATAGIPEVAGAFAQVNKQAQKFEEQTTKASAKGSRDRVGGAEREARDREKISSKLAKEQQKLEQQKTRDAAEETKRRESIVRRSSEMAGKEAEKAANAEIKAKQRATREIEREEARKLRIVIRSSEMAGQAAERAAREEAQAAARGASEAAAARAKYSRGLIGGAGRGISSLGGTIKGVAGMAAGGMAMMGGFAFADAFRKEQTFESTAAKLVNAGTTGGVRPGSVADVSAVASREAVLTGMSKEVIAGAALKYSQNARGGDFQGALGNVGFFAKLAKVSGADINDVAESAGILQSQNASLQGKAGQGAMQSMMLNVLAQTHEGSMSFADVAKQMGTLGSTRSFFTADEGESQRKLIGLGQIARVGGDAGEAGTFVKDIAMEVGMANRKYRKTHGKNLVNVDKEGRMGSVESMVGDVLRGTSGIDEIGDLFGKRGSVLFRELYKTFDTGKKKGGVEGGVQAALANVNQVAGATMSMGDFESQFQTSQNTGGDRFERATNAITTQMEDAIAPAMEKLATTLENPDVQQGLSSIVSAVGTVVAYLAENPFKGLGAIILAKVGADLAQAGIGAAVRAIITAMLAGSAAPGGIAGATGAALAKGAGYAGAGGALALGAAAAVGGAIGVGSGVALVDYNLAQQNKAHVASVLGSAQASSDAAHMQRLARGGKVTAADLAAMQGRANAMATNVEQNRLAIGGDPKGMFMMQAAMMGLFGGKAGQQFAQDTRADQKAQYEASKKALQDLNAAIKVAADALSAMKSTVPTPPPPVHAGAPPGPIPSRPTM